MAHFSPNLRDKAEQFFGLSFANVVLRISDLPRALGAEAFAYGQTLYFPPGTDFTKPYDLALLGHELTHVAQQMAGRVSPQTLFHGHHFNDDAALEAEAWRLGWRFAKGLPCDVSFARAKEAATPVLQCAVLVGDQMIQSTSDLSAETQTTLALIEDGTAWVNWAAQDMNVRYSFDNTYDLTAVVQRGLHGNILLLLNKLGLFVNPLRLMTLDPQSFECITAYELSSNNRGRSKAIKAMESNQLHPQSDLSTVDDFLASLVFEPEPVFQALGLNDRIALFNLKVWMNQRLDPISPLRQTAAGYATSIAQSPVEFADYVQYYITLALREAWDPDLDQSDQANQLLGQLRPALRNLLRGAVIEARPSTKALQEFIAAWQDMGMPLGFQRLSAAVNQVTQNTSVTTTSQPITPVIQQYLEAAQAYIRNQEADSISLSQDGQISKYTFTSDNQFAELNWNNAGVLTLQSYGTQGGQSEEETPTVELSSTKGASHGNQKGKSQTTRSKTKTSTTRTKAKE